MMMEGTGEDAVQRAKRCIALIHGAKTDNEKMAALLLVTKLIHTGGDLDGAWRRKVFDAVGFSFINRLLATKTTPEGCPSSAFQKIALAILACFCTDAELVLHPQITSRIPLFASLLLPPESSEESECLVEDSLQCLQAFSSSDAGMQYLLKSSALESLVQCYIAHGTGSKQAGELAVRLLAHGECASKRSKAVLDKLAVEFDTKQDMMKFTLCDMLSSVLLVLPQTPDHTDASVGHIANGLRDILTSKLDSSQRGAAFNLSAVLCQVCHGVEWAIGSADRHNCPGTFLQVLVNLASIEIQLLLQSKKEEGKTLEELAQFPVLCSCLCMMEMGVVYTAKQAGEGSVSESSPSTEVLLQLHSAILEAVTAIVHFLSGLQASRDRSQLLIADVHPVVVATVRVLGAWLAEESLELSTEVYGLLPFLLLLCDPSPRDRGCPVQDGLIKFILPGLCHLTADDVPRAILMKAQLPYTITKYLQHLWGESVKEWNGEGEVQELHNRMCTCCAVVMNICVCESTAVSSQAFSQLKDFFIANKVASLESTPLMLHLNVTCSLLMIIRRQEQLCYEQYEDTFQHVCQVLVRGLKCRREGLEWRDVSELWFLTSQELCAIIAACNCAGVTVKESVSSLIELCSRFDELDLTKGDEDAFLTARKRLCSVLQVRNFH